MSNKVIYTNPLFKNDMEKKRAERSYIYRQIVSVLKQGKLNVLQISEKTKINWQTVKNALDTLESINLVKKEDKKNKIVYSIKQQLDLPKNTLLNLPVKEEKLTKQIAKRITELWKQQTKEDIKKTFLQKILVKLIKKENLNIPYGWYLFGQCIVLQFNQLDLDSITKFDKSINNIINDYKNIPNTNKLLKKHYKEENNIVYLDKLKIVEILKMPFNKDYIEMLDANLKDMVFTFNGTEEANNYLDIYYSLSVQLFKLKNTEEFRQILLETFMALWELLAADNLYNSLKDYYDKEILDYCYNQRKIYLTETVEKYLEELHSCIPRIKIDKNSELFKLMGSAKVK